MSFPTVPPIAISGLAFLLAASFSDFKLEEQAVIAAFFSTLGDAIALNSSYIVLLESQQMDNNEKNQEDDLQDKKYASSDDYELLKRSIEKIQKDLNKLQSFK